MHHGQRRRTWSIRPRTCLRSSFTNPIRVPLARPSSSNQVRRAGMRAGGTPPTAAVCPPGANGAAVGWGMRPRQGNSARRHPLSTNVVDIGREGGRGVRAFRSDEPHQAFRRRPTGRTAHRVELAGSSRRSHPTGSALRARSLHQVAGRGSPSRSGEPLPTRQRSGVEPEHPAHFERHRYPTGNVRGSNACRRHGRPSECTPSARDCCAGVTLGGSGGFAPATVARWVTPIASAAENAEHAPEARSRPRASACGNPASRGGGAGLGNNENRGCRGFPGVVAFLTTIDADATRSNPATAQERRTGRRWAAPGAGRSP